MFDFKATYNRTDFLSFLQHDFLPEDFDPKEEPIDIDFPSTYATEVYRIGVCKSLELEVFEVYHDSSHDARVGISKDAFQLLLKKSLCNRALVVFVPTESEQYRLSLIQIDISQADNESRIRRTYSNPRRYSFLLGKGAHTKTPEQFLIKKGRIKPKDGSLFKDLQERFSVEVLTKLFYKELSDWYFWAIKNVSFPNDIHDDNDDEKYNLENVIRLITRLIFVWFLKQKDLVSNDLFNKESLMALLKDFKPESVTQNNYYRAILQNLFFATLNQEIDKRGFAEDKGYLLNRGTNTIKNLYRYENEFKVDTAEIMNKFSRVPFLNGVLFECLDNKEKEGKKYCWDGFSRDTKLQANVPNKLFFAKEQVVDLSKEYNDKKMNAVKVSGIIEILDKYNFTVEENTPIEVEVALDPELLGKVFENLLGAFNPETQETARKQTGSFYTPREIVNYMVNESLIAYFKTKVPDVAEETLRSLFSYEENSVELSETDSEELIQAIFNCKILDPATGSGAFPMGILQQMVHLLGKLDPDNDFWNKLVMDDALKAFENAEELSDEDRKDRLDEIERTFDDNVNHPNYARKLYLIENCIYGVDIQSIAVQISKLRFFISLVCEQTHSNDAANNFGIRPLPNLETKFVAANTLIGIEKNEEDMALFKQDKILKLVAQLTNIRHRQFMVTNSQLKESLRVQDETLRHKIVTEVQILYVKRADDDIFRLKMQLKQTEKDLEVLNKKLDIVRPSVQFALFGDDKKQNINVTEKKRAELNKLIDLQKKQITEGSNYSRLESVVQLAEQLTSWDPYDQNNHSEFFDPEWMFGIKGGFDLVIGNPPYIGISKLEDKNNLQKQEYTTFESTGDLYSLFYEKGNELLKLTGHLCYITSNKWLRAGYGKSLRKYFIEKTNPIQLIDFGQTMIFETAVVHSNILIFQNQQNAKLLQAVQFEQDLYKNNLSIRGYFSANKMTINHFDENIWTIASNSLQMIKTKAEFVGTPLKDWDIQFYRGLLTGLNEAFIIDENTKNKLIEEDDRNSEIIKPILRGRDVRKYSCNYNNLWIINSHNGIRQQNIPKIEVERDFPYIFKHLSSFLPKAELRADQGDHWTNLRNCAYINEFSQPKIVFSEIVSEAQFHYDEKGYYPEATVFFMTGANLKYLIALLNSKPVTFIFKTFYAGGELVGKFRYKKAFLENLPVPIINQNQQMVFEILVDQILSSKQANPQSPTTALERKIDELVFKLYDLTYAEVQVVCPDFWLSEEKYGEVRVG